MSVVVRTADRRGDGTAIKRVGVLISGRGSNLQALIDAQRAGTLGGAIAVVISNVDGVPGLDRARGAGIPALCCPQEGRSREDHDRALVALLQEHGAELVCLAGYMRILSSVFLEAFPSRILNVHPSLLPAFPGRDAQRQAWEHGVKVSGATVHMVEEGLDSGPILAQEAVAVADDDTLERLSARILEAEHRLYPRAVRLMLEGRYEREGRRLRLHAGA
jgi:phosphoribosylglycinamide formyltransferase-1